MIDYEEADHLTALRGEITKLKGACYEEAREILALRAALREACSTLVKMGVPITKWHRLVDRQ